MRYREFAWEALKCVQQKSRQRSEIHYGATQSLRSESPTAACLCDAHPARLNRSSSVSAVPTAGSHATERHHACQEISSRWLSAMDSCLWGDAPASRTHGFRQTSRTSRSCSSPSRSWICGRIRCSERNLTAGNISHTHSMEYLNRLPEMRNWWSSEGLVASVGRDSTNRKRSSRNRRAMSRRVWSSAPLPSLELTRSTCSVQRFPRSNSLTHSTKLTRCCCPSDFKTFRKSRANAPACPLSHFRSTSLSREAFDKCLTSRRCFRSHCAGSGSNRSRQTCNADSARRHATRRSCNASESWGESRNRTSDAPTEFNRCGITDNHEVRCWASGGMDSGPIRR